MVLAEQRGLGAEHHRRGPRLLRERLVHAGDRRAEDETARKAHEQAFVASLAAKLNLPVAQVQAAIEKAKPAPPAKPTAAEQKAMLALRLAEMVKSGKLTQAQADQILADIDAGKPVFEVLKQFMPQLGGPQHAPGDHGPQKDRPKQGGPQGHGPGNRVTDDHGPRNEQGKGA